MKNLKLISIAALASITLGAQAVVFNDPAGDQGLTSGSVGTHMDITTITVTNTASTITFDFGVSGDLVATNWGKYAVVLRNNALASGVLDNSMTNTAWGRSFHLVGGSSAFLGSWVDAAANNVQTWKYNASWTQGPTMTNVITGTNHVALTANLVDLGLATGSSITFDAVTTGGGGTDTAIDSLTGITPTTWGDNIALTGKQYTVTSAVPEPTSMAFLALAGVAILKRRKK